jgi:hypothetical protein
MKSFFSKALVLLLIVSLFPQADFARHARGAAASSGGGGSLAPVTNLQIAQQAGTSNSTAPITNSQMLTWTASAGATGGYNVYRNGTFLANTSSTSYTDSTATNSNPSGVTQVATVYAYTVKATDGTNESAAATPSMWMYKNGSNTTGSDLSYSGATINFNATDPAGGGQPVMLWTWPGGGGVQPGVGPPLAPGQNGFPNDGEIGAFNYLVLDIYVTSTEYTTNGLGVGVTSRIPPGDAFSLLQNSYQPELFSYCTPVVGQWVSCKIPLEDLHITSSGKKTCTGSIAGTGTGTGTLTVTACAGSNYIDNAGWITGANIPTGGWYTNNGNAQGSGTAAPPKGIGTWPIAGSGLTSSTSISSQTIFFERYNWYKDGHQWDHNPANPTTIYVRNYGVTTQ